MADNAPPYDQASLMPTLGMYALPYATVWPDLATQLTALYTDRAGAIPWLPDGWLNQVLALHGQNGFILVPGPPTYQGAPLPFLQSPDQQAWWADFNQRGAAIISQYAAQQQAAGAAALAALYADAEFWNTGFGATLIGAQQGLRSAGQSIVNTVTHPFSSPVFYVGAGLLALVLFLKFKK